jgi:hypothetical protein
MIAAGVALLAEFRAIMRQAAQNLGQWDTKGETAAFDPVEMVRRINEGRGEGWQPRRDAGGGVKRGVQTRAAFVRCSNCGALTLSTAQRTTPCQASLRMWEV